MLESFVWVVTIALLSGPLLAIILSLKSWHLSLRLRLEREMAMESVVRVFNYKRYNRRLK